MGKKIDSFVLTLAAAAGIYFYLLSRLHSRPAALILALICCLALAKLARRLGALLSNGRFMRARRVRRCASGAVMRLACMDEGEARERLSALLRASYGSQCPVELIQLHPSVKLPQDRLFDAWRAHRGEAELAVCATCASDADGRILAESLKSPRVALLDAPRLKQLICEHPEGFECAAEPVARRRMSRLRRAAALLCNRRNAPRGLLIALAMLAMYALGAGVAYLISAMALLFVSLVALHRPSRPAKLF